MTVSSPSRHTTRDRALTAARAAILEIGPSRTTMVELSRRSGVGRTTLYRHLQEQRGADGPNADRGAATS